MSKDSLYSAAKLPDPDIEIRLDLIDLKERIKKIESILDFTKKLDEKQSLYKRPHKCPVCDGKRFVATGFKIEEVIGADLKTANLCVSCEGKGIVWGYNILPGLCFRKIKCSRI